MTKGPLIWAAFILAILMMILSVTAILYRDFFIENFTTITVISGIIAALTIGVLVLMFLRMREKRP